VADNWTVAGDTGKRYLGDAEGDAAIAALAKAAKKDPSAENEAALALAYFQCERYEVAAERYRAALDLEAGNEEWSAMLALARANAAAEIDVPVPDVHFHDPAVLLAAPEVRPGAIPERPTPVSPPGRLRRARLVAGEVVGPTVSIVFGGLILAWGRIAGYRDEVWTNWYRRRVSLSVLTLGYMRERLNAHNLRSTYPRRSLIGFQEPGQAPPPGVRHFRTADGSWNNLSDPKEGAAGTRFPRNVANAAVRPETGERLMTPNPREISRRLLARGDEKKLVPFLNMLAAVWIQFQNDDWITHGQNLVPGAIEVPLAEDDPARRRYGQTTMFIGRTQPDPTRRPEDETPITFINEVTHWWDGSQIYGSDQDTQDRLRSGIDGKLRLHDDGTLPLTRKRVEDSGMVRNWWVGLSMFHLLFVNEHNAICDRLKAAHPDWDDTRLFNVARLVNAAVMAKIHSVEWTPAILPNPGLSLALNANWYGLLTNIFRRPSERRTVSDLNIRNPEMGGVVGNPIDKHGSPYGLTEEFVEVYRLHSLLPETLEIRRVGGDGVDEEIPFPASRQAGSRKVTERIAMPDLWHSFGTQHPGQLVLNNYPTFLRELSIPGNPLFDMGTVDILRARERGVPRYNEFRRQLGLNPIRTFADLTTDPDVVRRLEEVYGDRPQDVESLDLLIGTLAEQAPDNRPTGFGFGETMFQIFILNASRRLQADRFYTDDYNEETYTREGLDWIDRATLKRVLLRHHPELARTGLANVRNAFEPWDDDPQLDEQRHPLRAFDPELKKNPWVGDSYR
jgi:Animal haem peroxidase